LIATDVLQRWSDAVYAACLRSAVTPADREKLEVLGDIATAYVVVSIPEVRDITPDRSVEEAEAILACYGLDLVDAAVARLASAGFFELVPCADGCGNVVAVPALPVCSGCADHAH
jgi:hypothetical protein